jgi:hypothetical protein
VIEQLPPWHGIVQPPDLVQSMLQVAPALQVVRQPPAGSLQSTSQDVPAAHVVWHWPPGQATVQGCDGEPQAKLQDPRRFGSAPGVQVQLESLQAHCAPGDVGSDLHVTTGPPPPCPPWDGLPPRPVPDVLVAPPCDPAAPPVAKAPPVAAAEPPLPPDADPPVPWGDVALEPPDETDPPNPGLPPWLLVAPALPPVPVELLWLLPQPTVKDTIIPHIARTRIPARIEFLRWLHPSRARVLPKTASSHGQKTGPAYAERSRVPTGSQCGGSRVRI